MTTISILHVLACDRAAVEEALTTVFMGEGRPTALRLEGTYSAVLPRLTDSALPAGYRYLLLRPHPPAEWTPILELGNRADGLDVELSRGLEGAAIFTLFVYGDGVSGYRLARHGVLVDRYVSDPQFFDDDESGSPDVDVDGLRGRPQRFADLLPAGTTPDDFARVVLRPGWWEAHAGPTDPARRQAAAERAIAVEDDGAVDRLDDDGAVDEVDRMRCMALALELWGPSEYPFTEELEDLPNRLIGPALALAYR